MNDMTPAGIGHNRAPDPIEDVLAEFDAVISEAQNLTDGEPVTDEAGMKHVDAVLKEFKTYKTALAKAAKERTDPLHKAWKAEVAAVKVYTDDADRIQSALVASFADFKAKLAADQKEAERKAWEETNRLRREAEAKAARANAADLETQREVAAARQAAMDAENAARAKAKGGVKGMRDVTHYEIEDHKALLNWIAKNDRDAMTAFIEEWARRNHKGNGHADGLRVWTTREAF